MFTNLYAKDWSGKWQVVEECKAEKVGRYMIRLTGINSGIESMFARGDLRSTSVAERKALGLHNRKFD